MGRSSLQMVRLRLSITCANDNRCYTLTEDPTAILIITENFSKHHRRGYRFRILPPKLFRPLRAPSDRLASYSHPEGYGWCLTRDSKHEYLVTIGAEEASLDADRRPSSATSSRFGLFHHVAIPVMLLFLRWPSRCRKSRFFRDSFSHESEHLTKRELLKHASIFFTKTHVSGIEHSRFFRNAYSTQVNVS